MSDTPPPLQPESPQQTFPGPSKGTPPKSSSGKKWGIGCGIGCLAALILTVVLVIVGINVGKNWIADMIEAGVSDEPVELVAPTIPEDWINGAIRRFDAFTEAMEANEGVDPLILDEIDINGIIAHHPDFSDVADSMVVSIVDDKLTSEVSIDLDALGLPDSFLTDIIAGKYFNGEVTLSLGMMAGRPAMYLEEIAIDGKPLPSAFMSELSKENILAEAQSDPEAKKFFDKIEELKIEDNRLIIAPARAP
ncbi:MAG: hypothetical protein AAGF67_09830 [Verrucomicrobiota bacterium]